MKISFLHQGIMIRSTLKLKRKVNPRKNTLLMLYYESNYSFWALIENEKQKFQLRT
jgi:hypothetical protein